MNKRKLHAFIRRNWRELKAQGVELHEDHKLPMNRRDLFSAGLLTAGYTMMLPGSLSMLMSARSAQASTSGCAAPVAAGGLPFMQFHFAGGRQLWGYGLAIGVDGHGKPGSYSNASGMAEDDFFQFGLTPDTHPSKSGQEYVKLFGHEMPKHSYIYQAAFDYFGAERLAEIADKVSIVSFCHQAPDDTRDSLQSFLQPVRVLRGDADFNIVANNSGTNRSGLGALPAFAINESAVAVSNGDINALLDLGLPGSVDLHANFLSSLSNYGKAKLTNEQARLIMGCSAMEANKKLADFASGININTDPVISELMGGNIPLSQNLGSLLYMLGNNMSLCAGVTGGGYDYHDSTAVNGYEKNRQVFTNSVFPSIDYFLKKGQPAILLGTSDGSTRCNNVQETVTANINGETTDIPMGANTGDAGRQAGTMMVVINPEGKDFGLQHHQAGFGQRGGGVALSGNPIGGDQVAAASVILETIKRTMDNMTGNSTRATFQDAAAGGRFSANLESMMPVKKA